MKTITQLRELAGGIEGDLWKPRIKVDRVNSSWGWRDDAENPRFQWRAGFKSERAAWLAALAEYGVAVKAA